MLIRMRHQVGFEVARYHSFPLIHLCFIDSYVSQMQESSPNPANFPVKHANHGMSNSNPQHSNAPLVVVGSSRGPVEAEVPLHDPPAYDAISNLNRVSHQP